MAIAVIVGIWNDGIREQMSFRGSRKSFDGRVCSLGIMIGFNESRRILAGKPFEFC